jgi:hypothetical protein
LIAECQTGDQEIRRKKRNRNRRPGGKEVVKQEVRRQFLTGTGLVIVAENATL